MPAPGADRRPNGRSPLIANTTMPSAMNARAGDVVGAQGHGPPLGDPSKLAGDLPRFLCPRH